MITTKHKVFCSYAFTGEDEATVRERMQLITDTFQKRGVLAYCNLLDTRTQNLSGAKQFIDAALQEIKTSDVVFAVMSSERRSEGMLMEIGAAYAMGKRIVLARHTTAQGKTYIDQLAQKTIDWHTNDDLRHTIKELIV